MDAIANICLFIDFHVRLCVVEDYPNREIVFQNLPILNLINHCKNEIYFSPSSLNKRRWAWL